jgi:hypothetical protein
MVRAWTREELEELARVQARSEKQWLDRQDQERIDLNRRIDLWAEACGYEPHSIPAHESRSWRRRYAKAVLHGGATPKTR